MPETKYKLLDAGWGKQGLFTLLSGARGQLFIHYNKQPDGYAVFKLRGMNKEVAQDINRHLAEILIAGGRATKE